MGRKYIISLNKLEHVNKSSWIRFLDHFYKITDISSEYSLKATISLMSSVDASGRKPLDAQHHGNEQLVNQVKHRITDRIWKMSIKKVFFQVISTVA